MFPWRGVAGRGRGRGADNLLEAGVETGVEVGLEALDRRAQRQQLVLELAQLVLQSLHKHAANTRRAVTASERFPGGWAAMDARVGPHTSPRSTVNDVAAGIKERRFLPLT